MSIIIEIVGVVTGEKSPEDGKYVEDMDFEADDGRGHLTATESALKAKQFNSIEEALDFYQTSPKCHPVRKTDGRPNRPLTAYTVMFQTLHISPSYKPGCRHEWPREEVQDSDCCVKCGMSFTRYIFTEAP